MTEEEQTKLLKAIYQFNHKWYYKNWIQYILLVILSCIPLGAILVIPIIFFKWRYYKKHISSIAPPDHLQIVLSPHKTESPVITPIDTAHTEITDVTPSTETEENITDGIANKAPDAIPSKTSDIMPEENSDDIQHDINKNNKATSPTISTTKADPVSDYWNYWYNSDKNDINTRIERAKWISPNAIIMKQDMCLIQGTASTPYEVTLSNCTCPDFQRRKYTDYNYPCKHMCRLAIEKNMIPDTAYTPEEMTNTEIELLEMEAEEERILSQYKLTDDKISELINIINEPNLLPIENKNPDSMYSTAFDSKADRHMEKLDSLLEKLEQQHDSKKLLPIIEKLQSELVSFKKLFYEYGQDGANEYDCLYSADFTNTKEDIERILREDFPQTCREYYEELAYQEEVKKDKKIILNAIGTDSILQATVVNEHFPDCKSYARSLCKDLEKEGKIIRVKENNRYVLSRVHK